MIIIIIAIILGVVVGVLYNIWKSVQMKELKKMYSGEVVEANTYYIIDDGCLVLAKISNVKEKDKHIRIQKINDATIYEDGKEKSFGKALIGGVTFGIVGAIIGSNMKTQQVKNMGIKLYTDQGIFHLRFLLSKCKRNSFTYKAASNNIDKAYNIIKKYAIVENFKTIETVATDDIPEQIKKLSNLKDSGILTEEEFTTKKSELLAKM